MLKSTVLILLLIIGAVTLTMWSPEASAVRTLQPDASKLYREHCAACHDAAATTRAPTRSAMKQMSAEVILQALENGTMKQQGASLKPEQRRLLATFLSGKPLTTGAAPTSGAGFCAQPMRKLSDPFKTPFWNGWGVNTSNTRFQTAEMAGLRADQVPHLALRWAFEFPGTIVAYGQPTVAAGRVFVGSANRAVYSLDARTGCIVWKFDTMAPVRAAVTIGGIGKPERTVVFIGDQRAYVYAVDAASGELIWKMRADDQTVSRITGAPQLYKGRLYVPVSMPEDGLANNPKYECCRLRSNVVAVDAETGRQIWKTYTVSEEPKPQGKNAIGVQLWGPSGASVWSAPTIDPKLNVLYIGTGDNHSHPTTDTSDAILAINLDSGKIVWSKQLTKNDAYNTACVMADQTNCPQPPGPDYDFGSSAILVNLPGGKRALLAGQKSGVMHALDPDRQGEILWQTRVGKGGLLGGIQWGSAADGDKVYVPLSDIAFSASSSLAGGRLNPDPKAGGGLFALDIKTGNKIWYAPPAPCGDRTPCSPAQSAAATAIPGVVFSGSVDGHMRAFSTKDGRVIWDYDTAREYQTVNGAKARGGSLDAPGPVVAGGWLYLNSGYGYWGGMPGNVLLAFSVEER